MISESSAFRNLNISVFLHFLGRQLYSVFVPVVMLQNDYSLSMVLLFLLLSSVVTIFSSYVGQRFMHKRNVIYFNVFAVFSEILLLAFLSMSGLPLVAFAAILVFEGFYYAFYYLSYWSITTHYTSEENTGSNLGNLTIVVALASITGPLLGSYILDEGGAVLSLTAISVLFLSLVPLRSISSSKVEENSLERVDLSDSVNELVNYSFMALFEAVIFTLWSIYAYLSDFGLLNIGLIVSAISVARIILSVLIKDKMSDEVFRGKVMVLSVFFLILTSVYRFYLPENILVTNALMAISYVGFQLGSQTATINSLKGSRTYYSSMIMQVTTFGTRIAVYIIAFIVGLKSLILLPVFAGFLYMLLNYKQVVCVKNGFSSFVRQYVSVWWKIVKGIQLNREQLLGSVRR